MKRFQSLFFTSILIITAIHAASSGSADTYQEAIEKLESQSRPWFVDEQINAQSNNDRADLTQAVTFPETFKPIYAYDETRTRHLNSIIQSVDARLITDRSIAIQNQARIGNADALVTKRIDLFTLLNIAYARNPAIRSASQAWQASLNRYPQAAYLDGILHQYNAFTQTLNLMLGGMQKQRQRVDAEFPFPGVTSLRGDIVQTDVRIEEVNFAIVLRDVLTDVKKSYHEYLYIGEAIAITKENQTLLEQMLKVASRKFEAELVSYNDVLRARIALSTLSDHSITLSEQRNTIATKLNTLINRPPHAHLAKPIETHHHVPQKTLDELYSLAQIHRQEIKRTQLKEKRALQMISFAEKMNRPDPTFGASYFQDRSAFLVGSESARAAFNPKPALPLRPWFGQRESFITEMRHRKQALHEQVVNVINLTILNVKSAHFSMDTAKREYELYQTTLIPDAKQSFVVAEKDFEGTRIDFLDYLDAQRTWLDFNLASFLSKRDLGISTAELERAIGVSLSNQSELNQ